MKDHLKQYIDVNREQFNNYKLDDANKLDLWSKISDDLPEQQKTIIPLWRKMSFRVAASVLLFIGCAFTFLVTKQNYHGNQIVNHELSEIDSHYKLLVNSQIQLIKNNANLSETDQDDFLKLIDDLDTEYINLKKDLKDGIHNKKIIEAIISNYRKKIQLMEDLLLRTYTNKNDFDHGELIL